MRSISLLFAAMLFAGIVAGQSNYFEKRWSSVYRYEIKNLPKSALTVVDSIYAKAKRERNIPQLTKALLYQSKFALSLQEDAELLIVQKLKREIFESKTPQTNILESMVGKILWDYFQANRWKYYGRTNTSEKVDPTDFRTWDSRAMFAEIDKHFQNSLKNSEGLQKISLASINEILTQAENSKLYRPTVFDLLAHNALDFYRTNETLTEVEPNAIWKDTVLFEGFERMDFQTPDSLSTQVQAMKILQSLLHFHKADNNPSAYINLELERLQLLIQQGIFENESTHYKHALEKLSRQYAEHPASALVDFELASALLQEGKNYQEAKNEADQFKLRDALIICAKTIANYPQSDGAAKCNVLKQTIEGQQLQMTVERHIPILQPSRILVTYKNINALSFDVFKVSDSFETNFYDQLDSVLLAKIKSLPAEKQWSVSLTNLTDYQEHSTEVILPELSAGNYLVFTQVQSTSSFDPIFAYSFIQVTNLSLIEWALEDVYRFQVVDRNTGRPIVGADVHVRSSYHNENNRVDEHLTTNKDGFAEVARTARESGYLEVIVTAKDDRAVFGDYYFNEYYPRFRDNDEDYSLKSFLFADRSIYRPGQTVYFKGILIKTKNKKSTVVAGQYVEVFLEDVNGEEVGTLRLKTNAYGSFSGEFTLPASGLTGEYTLYADEDMEGDSRLYEKIDNFDYAELSISVEEYKRPTFEASFKPVKETFKLLDTVRVTGSAIAYNGSKISRAKFAYRVKRTVRYPHWYYWGNRPNNSEEEEIAFGEGVTDAMGEFSIPFKAFPDESVSPDEKPIFHYEVSVDVTDINGETRSATTTVNVGYHSMLATINNPPRIDRHEAISTISLATENLNNEFVPAKGTIHVYKLQSPASPVRERPWSAPDLPLLSEQEFKKLFPHDSYGDDSKPSQWKKGKEVAKFNFDTNKSKEVKLPIGDDWLLGSYLIELTTTDPNGMAVTDKNRFELFDASSKQISDNILFKFETDKASYRVGDIMNVTIGSSSEDITMVVDLERDHEIVKTFIERLQRNSKTLAIPVTPAMSEGFAIHMHAVNYNSTVSQSRTLAVVSDEDEIEIETLRFKDKLQPGGKETWSFQIKGDEALQKETEILASMYDASLDQFKTHEWEFNPIQRSSYYSYFRSSTRQSFSEQGFIIRNAVQHFFSLPKQHYDQFDWFGFSITNNYYLKRQYLERLYTSDYDGDTPSTVTMKNTKNGRSGFVSGRIVSTEDGTPLPGVNVIVKGTTTGTVTDVNGYYTIEADKGDVLVYSFIGFSSIETNVARKNTIDVSLTADVQQLEEVVVTALGVAVEKKSLSYSVSTVYSDSTSVDYAFSTNLQGKAAGVQISGMPGGTAKLMIRGANSVAGKNEPLYVVDGVLVEASKIDQEDLANIQVLKGAAATAIYGSRAINGVIIVTTKSGQKKIDEELSKVMARQNFKETAFFFPHITTDETGQFKFTFTTPESLTRWKLQLLAHTKDLVTTTKTLQTITQKEFMITPNAPRFLRVGDDVTFSVKISNLTGKGKDGKIGLVLTNAITGASIDQQLFNINRNQVFKLGAKANDEISWKLKIPSGVDAVQYKVVAKAGNFSDGEQNIIPVLSNRMLVTETMPMYVRSGQTKTFKLDKLKTTDSKTLQHHLLTLEVTSNPVWYAIQSLPYLMEYPHECAEQLFSRFYANTLASHIVNSNPKIKQVFEAWSSSGALISDLEKNQELKSLVIQETPWLRDAQNESEQKKRIALLFDLNTMKNQSAAVITKLDNMQFGNGGFPWFAGARDASRYITQHIATGFGHLKQLNVALPDDNTKQIIQLSVGYLDRQIEQDYTWLQQRAQKLRVDAKTKQEGEARAKQFLADRHVSYNQIQYLYMRSFFSEIPLSENTSTARDYYRQQTELYWNDFNLYMKGMIALIQHRNGNSKLAADILKSLKENSIVSEELGMYWKENKSGWNWYESDVETQALLIEAFAEIESQNKTISQEEKTKTIDELRVWLLKNKQTTQWKSTKATTEGVYALLLNGTEWLALDKQVEITVGGNKIAADPKSVEAGTGYFKTSWKEESITPSMSEVTLTKKDDGIAWGGFYWQYFEDLDKITPAETPLKLGKKVFVVKRTDQGEVLTEVKNTPLAVGDLVRVRIELRVDRPMEFLHMKDMRASGLEPVDVLSEYKWQDGLGYYQSTRDASTNFFFDSVQKGVYVFEYDLRVNNKGDFSNGITTIQSMYAPEFSSHSEGVRIVVE